MATIAGVDVGAWSLPENDTRTQNTSVGQSASGSVKFYKFRASDRIVTIILKRKSLTVKNNLVTALEADADYNVALAPESWVDVGGGAGVSVNAQWIDKQFNAVKINHDAFDISLNFLVIP